MVLLGLLVALPLPQAQDYADTCRHENYNNVGGSVELGDGETTYQKIVPNETHRYFHRNFNVTTINTPDIYRKLLINLEPCRGIVYLFVRKTRRCYPNPYSCINIATGERNSDDCTWTHFMSEIDGSRDGTPTLFEVPLSSTMFYISVFAMTAAEYTLTVLADIGAFPRPGGDGIMTARQMRELEVELSWKQAFYFPEGVSETKQYWVYSSLLLEDDNRTNQAVFLRPDKVMNTVCGLSNNTDKHYAILPADRCMKGICNITIRGVVSDKRYVFNVVAESTRNFNFAYGGLIIRTQWQVIRQATDDKTLKVVGAVSGSVLAIVVIIYFMMLKLYG